MPIEPPGTAYDFSVAQDGPDDLIALGADLAPGTLLAAYRHGLFPMGVGPGGSDPIGWWAPEHRGVLTCGDHHVQRSLRRSARQFTVSIDQAFAQVVAACGDPSRHGAWITPSIASAYQNLHELGWAHSVEVWAGGQLAGGLYGVSIGGFFAGESMFHHQRDAGKVALWVLDRIVFDAEPAAAHRLIDVQWQTAHLATQGVREIDRATYRSLLRRALEQPAPQAWESAPVAAIVRGLPEER